MFGFKDANHYYETISCSARLNKIRVPSFFLMSKDDFLFDDSLIPYDEIK
jgi:predicted alpha/beta-fold hydrolase